MIVLVVFVVAMVLWLVSIVTDLPPPWSKAAAICAWISVLCLFLMVHGTRI